MTDRKLTPSAVLTFIAAYLALIAASPTACAQDEPTSPKPTPEHELLKKDVGAWDAVVKIWTAPDAKPVESKATEKNELLPGDMWLLSRFDGSIGDMKFAGFGTFGYDPVEKKYIGTWVDSMSPYLMTMKADHDPATRTMTAVGEGRDAMTGKMMKTKHVSRYIDDNTRTFEMYMAGPDGKDFKMMEITYKRSAE